MKDASSQTVVRRPGVGGGFRCAVALLALACGSVGWAADDAGATRQGADQLARMLVHVPPTEPAESLKTFRVEPGFRVELVAAEPLVSDPVDIAWDEDGRMYVCELWNYPGEPKAGEPLGRVRLLTSSRGDGVYDRSVVFADGLKWPGGVACYDGGVFVVASPDVWYLKDTNGDGRADVRRKVLTGFAGKTYEVANSPRWALDNHVYLSGSYAGGTVAPCSPDDKPVGDGVRSRDFRFDPATRAVEAVPGGGEWGQTFDDWGERYTCDATHLVWHPTVLRDATGHNPYFSPSSGQEMSMPEWTRLFPVSRPEPWKAARQQFWQRWVNTTHDMNAGRFPATELAPHGFATSACGITVYRGSAFGPDYLNDAFVAEPANNVVVRLKLRADGAGVKADRPARDAAEGREFLASTDNWFRPVNFANGPDGLLYVVAMYREIIEDDTAIPDDILKHYDLYSGRDRGRILRVVPEGFTPPVPPRLGSATLPELAALLDHPDAWRRETAQRLLVERGGLAQSHAEAVRAVARGARRPQGKIHALWTLQGDGALDESTLLGAMTDADPHVRAHGVRLASTRVGGSVAVREAVASAAGDPDARVRLHAVLALGAAGGGAAATEALARAARRDTADPRMRDALLASSAECAAALFGALAGDETFVAGDGAADLLGGLARIAGVRTNAEEVSAVLKAITGPPLARHPGAQRRAFRELADGLSRGGASLADRLGPGWAAGAALPEPIADLFASARRTAFDAKAAPRERVEAVALLAHLPSAAALDDLGRLLGPEHPPAVQVAAVRGLAARSDPGVAAVLLSRWPALGPDVRPAVMEALFRRPERLAALLDAVQRGQVAAAEIDAGRRDELLHGDDSALRVRAEKLLATTTPRDKKQLIARYAAAVAPLPGDAGRGEVVFRATCTACHRPERGERVGPNLATLQDRSPATLLVSILDPNREVKPAFVNYVVRTKDHQDLSGIIANATDAGVTVRQPLGIEEVVLRSNIDRIRSTGRSLMPEGLEAGIDPQAMADLLAFIGRMKD